jgi:DNA-binding beta-propeller fold protein YncE
MPEGTTRTGFFSALGRGRGGRWRGAPAAAAVVAFGLLAAGAVWAVKAPAERAPRADAAVNIGGVPSALAIDDAANTVYVAAGRAGLALLNKAACDPAGAGRSGCRVRRIRTGDRIPDAVAAEASAHTVYVAEASGPGQGLIAVMDTARCDAADTRGCSRPAALIPLRGVPLQLALDPRSGTLYADELVGSSARQLAVIGTKACSALVTSGCRARLATALGQGMAGSLSVDAATGTVYASGGSELSVVNGRSCAAGNARACATPVASVPTHGYITGITVTGAGLVYLTSPGTGTVSVLNGSSCGLSRLTGCSRPMIIRAGAGPVAIASDPATHSLYVTDVATSTVSIASAAGCVAPESACPSAAAAFPVGGYPAAVAADPGTHTLYVANEGSRSVSVINTATCNAMTQRGCPAGHPPGTPAIPSTPSTCDPDVSAFHSGQSAAQFTRHAARAAAGTTGGLDWQVWARKGLFDPNAVEQGGLVVDGRWYALCAAPLDASADAANMELIDTAGGGIVYGYIQHGRRVAITLAGPGPLPAPITVGLPGTTFFIETLARPACDYPRLFLRGQAPGWGGETALTFSGACIPGQLVGINASQGTWGPRR